MGKSHLLKCKSHWSCRIDDSKKLHTRKCDDCGNFKCKCTCGNEE